MKDQHLGIFPLLEKASDYLFKWNVYLLTGKKFLILLLLIFFLINKKI